VGEPVSLEDLQPTHADGELARTRPRDVPLQVLPTVRGSFVAEAAVQLHDRGQAQVRDVADVRTRTERSGVVRRVWHTSANAATAPSSVREAAATWSAAGSRRIRGGDRCCWACASNAVSRATRRPG
jgi:hypothetical protein